MLIFYFIKVIYSFNLCVITLCNDIANLYTRHMCRRVGCHAYNIDTDLKIISLCILFGNGSARKTYNRSALYIAIGNKVFNNRFCITYWNCKPNTLFIAIQIDLHNRNIYGRTKRQNKP